MRHAQFIFPFVVTLILVGCKSGVTNTGISSDSDFGRQILELDAKGRAVQNEPLFSKTIQDFEATHSGNCTNITFTQLEEPGQRINRYVRLYMMEGNSPTCGKRSYCTKITFDDAANTVAKKAKVLIGPDEELNYRNKAAEFIRDAQAGDVQQMLEITSSLSHATESDSLHTVYAKQVIPQFRGRTVIWSAHDIPIIDENRNIGLAFTGNAEGTNKFSFDVAVYKENGKFVVSNIQKEH